ncbi:MAG: DUF2189 domain-containing protein [Gammaproteobacteria bacterium]|jgi:uncharacterized membrane protein
MHQTHEVKRIDYEPIPTPELRKVPPDAPFSWIKAGIQDFRAAPLMSIAYGLLFALIGIAITVASINQPQFTLTFWTGFLLVGPFLAIGLYRAAQLHEQDEKMEAGRCVRTLFRNKSQVAVFMVLMLVIMVAWVRFSTLMVALWFGQLSPGIEAFTSALTSPEGLIFLAILFASGGLFAFIVFAASALTLPMLLDGKAELIPALITSFRVVFKQPRVMLTWAAIVAGLTFIGMATMFVGLVFIFPLLGYATWHSYRDLVK